MFWDVSDQLLLLNHGGRSFKLQSVLLPRAGSLDGPKSSCISVGWSESGYFCGSYW